MAYEPSKNIKVSNVKFNPENKNVKVGETTAIPTGNAQTLYDIDGRPKERFSVSKNGMLPIGEYEVQEKNNEMYTAFGTFSELIVKRLK